VADLLLHGVDVPAVGDRAYRAGVWPDDEPVSSPKEAYLEAITGELGGGKSALGVEYMYEHCARGHWAFSNIECFPDETYPHPAAKADNFKKRMAGEGLEFDPSRLVKLEGNSMEQFHKQLRRGEEGAPVLCVIDESQLDLHTDDRHTKKNDPAAKELYNFLAMCRKLDIWCVFIAHDAMEIDFNARRKFTTETTCRNLKQEKLMGAIPFPFPIYFRVKFKLFNGRVHHKLSSDFLLRCPSWGLYNSKALLGAKAQVFEGMTVARSARLKRIQPPGTFSPWTIPAVAGAVAALSCVL
jgi:hypothetical protein